jgi:hypothetical protein
MMNLDVSVSEALELGKIEGQKAILQELINMKSSDIVYMNAYLSARLKTLEDGIIMLVKFQQIKGE